VRPGAWSELADVIYIDNPVGVGFSYGDNYVTSMRTLADELVNFMDQLVTLFPEYSVPLGSKIYLAGESFGGKYLSLFGRKMIVF